MANESTTTTAIPELKAESLETLKPLTPSQLVWRRFRKHHMAIVGAFGAIAMILFIVLGSIIVPERAANQGELTERLQAPAANHFFGTDSNGRNVFNRI